MSRPANPSHTIHCTLQGNVPNLDTLSLVPLIQAAKSDARTYKLNISTLPLQAMGRPGPVPCADQQPHAHCGRVPGRDWPQRRPRVHCPRPRVEHPRALLPRLSLCKGEHGYAGLYCAYEKHAGLPRDTRADNSLLRPAKHSLSLGMVSLESR